MFLRSIIQSYWRFHFLQIKRYNMKRQYPTIIMADNSVKIDYICQCAIPKQISTISMQIWWKSIEIYSSYCPESKIQMYCGQRTLSKMDVCLIAIPKQISTISMHVPSLVKIHWHLLTLSSINENTNVSWADNSVKNLRNLSITNSKPDLHNINSHTKFGENPLIFTIVRKWK